MKVIRADILGYCMGVRRAVDTANNALTNKSSTVYTLGPLIHNKMALEALSQKGLQVLTEQKIDNLDDKKNNVVIIRAHGISPIVRKKLNAKKCSVIDATCPRVLTSQRLASDCASKGMTVIIAGDKLHGEVTGIAGCATYAGQECIVVENKNDVENLKEYPQKAVLISQTTISRNEYDAIAEALKKRISDLKVFNSICPATIERQNALDELCKKVDAVLVIGGKNSANTQRLYMTALEKSKLGYRCHDAFLIETPEEIPKEIFNLDVVGLTAGASTPDEVIDNVENTLFLYTTV